MGIFQQGGERSEGGLRAALNASPGRAPHGGSPALPGADVVEGLESLLAILGAMQQQASKRVLRGALRYGLAAVGTAIRKESRRGLSRPPKRRTRDAWRVARGKSRKHIPQAIGTSVGRDREGVVNAKTGVFVGHARRRRSRENWFAFLLALGTSERFRKSKQGAPTGSIQAEDFVRRGYALSAHLAQQRISQRATQLIDKEILKAKTR